MHPRELSSCKVCGCATYSEHPCEECYPNAEHIATREILENRMFREYILYCNKTENNELIDVRHLYAS